MPDPSKTKPDEVAIFPLNLVLFPGASLPLKIFEQRYIEMTKTCLRDDTPFGVCLIRHGQEVGSPAEHEQIGCSARIGNWDMPHTGIFLLACAGENTFRLLESRTERNGLIKGRVEWLYRDDDEIDPAHLDTCRNVLRALVKRTGEDVFAGPTVFDDPEWVSYRLSELLPIDNQGKQALLEQRGTGQRLAAINKVLQPD
ncbi:MAG TPA: LON peptidase substrate-binding domain-containing protein [Burkholderiales bacterium]|nr:LON peptidase substrate-binding domain-containing protein [Burkholderiales bacterium]